jgi:hypothetical protein
VAKLILGALVLVLVALVVIRWIMKLPSRYERTPKTLSPWNSLDQGIDPSVSDEGKL